MGLKKLSDEILRAHKGISFTGITTLFFCYDDKGRVFLTKRSNNARDEHGRWDPGAGGLKHGQAVEDNMRRELKEEYDAEPLKTDFIGYFDAFRTAADGTPTHWLAMCFAVLVDPKQIKINEPDMVDDHAWFDINNLPSPLHSQIEVFMNKYGDKFKNLIQPNS